MKKITFLFTLALLPFFGTAQTFDFNNTDDGFTEASACTLSTTATYLSVDLTGDGTNPNFGALSAGVDADANPFVGVTIKNGDAAGPTFMRISYPRASGGRRYVNLDITAGDADYKTYWFDLTNGDWAGTEDDIKVHFKAAGNVTYTTPTVGVNLEIDKIEFASAIPTEEKEIYEFNTDGDAEGWGELDATADVSGGIFTITPIEDTASKVVQNTYAVNASANSYIHIVYKNNSALNNQLRLQFRYSGDGFGSFYGTNVSINQSMGAFETLSVDLASARPEWTGMAEDFQIIIRDTDNDDVTNNAASPGTLEIDRIVFDNNATLSTDQFEATKFSLYPNPANEMVSVSSNSEIELVRIFDITGKLVLSSKATNNNGINIADLKTGVYLFNVIMANGNQATKKLIKE